MRPPLCAVCGTNDFDRFTAPGSENVVLFSDHTPPAPGPDGLVPPGGNPFPGSDWFCDEHLAQAKQLAHLTLGEALAAIRDPAAGAASAPGAAATSLPSQEEIVERLMADWGYNPVTAEQVATDLQELSAPVAPAFVSWWETGVIPDLEIDGYSVARLVGFGLEVPGTFTLLDWLVREPEIARARLRELEERGYDEVLP